MLDCVATHVRTVKKRKSKLIQYSRLGFLSACAYFKNCKKHALKSQLHLNIREN